LSLKLELRRGVERKPQREQTVKVAAVIPAYNEEKRICAVLEALALAPSISEVVVVSDGSTDRTYEVVCGMPKVNAVQLPVNRGKGGAMLAGARVTDADVLLFFDADLIGLTPQHVEDLIAPVCSGEYTMATGVLYGARFATDIAQFFSPGITGQRAVRRDVFLTIPDLENVGYGIELAINYNLLHNGYTRKVVRLRGVTHPMKEEKLGWMLGIASRSVMYWQMLKFRLRYEFRRIAKRSR
jgi:glycosyltransferase involved in cell wall biosynthesis